MEGGGATLDSGTNIELRSTPSPSAGCIDDSGRKVMDFRRTKQERDEFLACIEIMQEEEEEEDGTVAKTMPDERIVLYHDLLGKLWGWERLVPFAHSVSWAEYIIYLEAYHSHNASKLLHGAAAAMGSSVTSPAETFLEKEKDLVSRWTIWRTKMDIISLSKSIVLSCLIHGCARSVISTAGCNFSDVCSAALLCIFKEADLMCELMSCGADPVYDYLIEQSCEIRLCALSLMNCTSRYSVAASAAMLGIAKEAQVMCEWMRKEDRLIDLVYGDCIPEFFLDSRDIRRQTLNIMIKMIEESSVAAGHKTGNKEPASTNGLGSNRNNIDIDQLANATGGRISDVLNSQDQKIKEPEKRENGNMKGEDFLDNLWGWERQLPLHISFGSDHSSYREKYYNRNALHFIAEAAANQTPEGLLDPSFGSVQIVSKAGCHFADSVAIFCLKMEEELLAEWKARVELPGLDGILPVNSIIHSSLIKEHVLSICGTGGDFSIPAAVAFVSIAKEADLMIELLKHGAEPDNDILEQSGVIRMCALGLVNLKGRQSIATASAMMGMAREARVMRDWIKRENKLPSSILGELLDLGDARLIRTRTLDVMISILQESSFPSS